MRPIRAVIGIGIGLLVLQLTCAVFGNPMEQRRQRANAIDSVGEIKTSITNNYGRGKRAAIGSVGNFITGEMHTYGGSSHGSNRHKKPGHEAIENIDNMYVGNMVNPPVDYSTEVPPPPSSSSSSSPDYSNSVPDFLPLESTPVPPMPTPSNDTFVNFTYDNRIDTGNGGNNIISPSSSMVPGNSGSGPEMTLPGQNSGVVKLPTSAFTGDPSDSGSIELVPYDSGSPPPRGQGQGLEDPLSALNSGQLRAILVKMANH